MILLALFTGSSPSVLDVIQTVTGTVAVIIGTIAATTAIYERFQELRWKRSNAAKELIDDIHHHPLAAQAVHMLDWHDGQKPQKHTITENTVVQISYPQVLTALKLRKSECEEECDIYIHDCFDWFFYFIDRIEHSIKRKLIRRNDVKAIFTPYVKIVSANWAVYEEFLSRHYYDQAKKFFQSYAEFGSITTHQS